MENNDLDHLVAGAAGPLPAPARTVSKVALGLYTRFAVDRLAFATPAAGSTYRALPFVRGIPQRVFTELPAAALDGAPATGQKDDDEAEVAPGRTRATFVGVLEGRKGVHELLRAWEQIEGGDADARLTVIGPGPLAGAVADWAARRPASRRYLGPLPRSKVLEQLASSSILLAPSLPEGRWREQVGLPIKEALSVGTTVVTTCQTGLASWLEQRGHFIVSVDGADFVDRFAAAAQVALREPLRRRDVLASLPERDARIDADAWLHERVPQ
ncbi:hypothetical protein GCM10025867_04240 [Frondihabitans sucicola]|uniref:D-inositol 3-phosphate glycosyltransferase n=2 Tax=Frondihabitans sucicola TaxID=1268041 RepID=A0ABM8GII6_9MICO|nr:hypothetical protein GCM10025867_04240 [Frondihabitans sucicola]